MGFWGIASFRNGVLASSVLLCACGSDLLGHPGSALPDPARQHLSVRAQALIQRHLADLPSPLVDVAAWPNPALATWLPTPWPEAVIDDATSGSAPHSLLRNQIGIGMPIRSFVRYPQDDWLGGADWHVAEVDNSGHSAAWLDTSAADSNWQQRLAGLPDNQTAVLLHCDAGQTEGLRACLRALRSHDNTVLALGGLTVRSAIPDGLMPLLQQTSLHNRYRWSSAWPQPAINWLLWLRPLAKHGFIAEADIKPLREIYADNPLLFDIVLWRSIRLPGTDIGLPVEVFSGLPEADEPAEP